jgi:signal transduction histidine kinase/CheY-like chemotaxis protein
VSLVTLATGGPSRREAALLAESEAVGRLELLVAVSRLLSRAMEDYVPALADVAEACVPDFCDLCAIELTGEGGDHQTVVCRLSASSKLTVGETWAPTPPGLVTGRAATLSYARPDEPEATRQLREDLGAGSLIVAPISAGSLTLGRMVLATSTGRERGFRPSALRVAEDVSTRLATTIQRVQLYRESVAAGSQQARTARRLRRLASGAANLAGAVTPAEVLRVACVEICIILDGDAAAARWSTAGTADIDVVVGTPELTIVDAALGAAMKGEAPRGQGWIAAPLPCTDPLQRGGLAVLSHRELSVDDETMLASLAAMVPVAFERARSTEAAVLHEAELDAVLDASPVAIVRIRPDGVVTGANQAARSLFGWGHASEERRFPPPVAPAMLRLPHDVAVAGSVANRAVSGDGLELSVSAAPMPGVGSHDRSILVVATDVSEQREMERALLQAQRLEAMGQVAGGIAHDFNNLLTVMIGYTSMLQRTLADDASRHMLGNIETAVNRAAALTQQLLGFTRRPMDDPVILDLVQSVYGLHSVLERMVGPEITLDLRLPDSPVWVLADPSAVEQMILNLSINGRDAMELGGKLTLSVDAAEVGNDHASHLGIPAGDYACMVVADTGPGMSEDVLSRCLEPFFTTKERGRGSGLGLSTVYGHSAERGGTLTIDSSPEQGTTIHVWLPRSALGATRTDAGGDTTTPPLLSGRALVVEDQEDLRLLARAALTDVGLEVVDAPDAESALGGRYDEGPWDVLVTDIVLPGMSGVELATRLRSVQPQLAVLYVSGYADRDTRRRGLVDGGRLLRKPYRPEDLCRRVADLLEPSSQELRPG